MTDPNYHSLSQLRDMQKLNKDLDKSLGVLGNAPTPTPTDKTGAQWSIWTAGNISLGRLNNQGGTSSRFTSEGVTAGFDARVMDGLRVGVAVGFGDDKTKVGTLGSRSNGANVSGTLYSSYRVMPKTFIDVMAGYGQMRLTSRRFDTVNSVFLEGNRNGHQFHSSVAMTYNAQWGKWKVSPYGKFEILHIKLDDFVESGLGIAALAFKSVNTTSYSGVLGLRTSYPITMSWGTLTPQSRIEYRLISDGGYSQALGFADTPGLTPYSIVNKSTGSGQLTIGLGTKATFERGGALDFEYQFSASVSPTRNFSNTIRGRYQLDF